MGLSNTGINTGLCGAKWAEAQEKESSPAKTPPKAASPAGETKNAQKQQAPTSDEDSAEAARQKQIIDRFVTVLERNPRRGTAFDKIYGYHIENGTVEALAQQFRDRASKNETDYAAWMILGLIESQRGRDAAAVEAFAKAKEAKKDDPIAPYYHGQALVLIGRGDDAVPSLEEAIARKPTQVDLFEIIQALGRVHQRAQRSEKALAVWNQFEKAFPGDARVQEQIAVTLAEEGQFAEALPRYEALVKSARDEYRKATFQIEAAELKVKLKRSSDGIADLEGLLGKLNPDSWLFREVRRRIENVFLRTEDQEGLVKYYLAWAGKHAEDVDAMARLSRLLARQARVPEAREWLDKALKIAPSRKDLRLAFIQQLVEDHRFSDAIDQYKLLDQSDPNNPDYLREWGRLVMRDGARPIEEKRKDAAQIWKKLLASRGNDPLATVQVADLLRNAGLNEEALPLYEKAVELAPTAPQYREFLGEYLHLLKRPEEALAVWRKIAEGKQRTPDNLARLAEVLSQFGYAREASTEILAAAELDARDFSLQLRAADYQARADQLDGALASLGRAESLSQNDEEREAVLAQRMRILQQMGKLTDAAEELRAALEKETSKDAATADKWYRLARYQESLRLLPEATKSIAKSLELAPNNIPALASAARIDEQAGAVAGAVERFRKLSIVDRRSKSDYLTQIARLEVQMGRTEEALTDGRDLIAASPGNIEAYQFFADLCFKLNRREEGLTALRRSVRANPTDPAALLPLAAALAGDFRTDEAIEVYWQAFEKSPTLDDKLTVINRLTDLYLQQGQFDRLVERLDRNRREEDARREMTICLAQAHQTAGDVGLARQELQTLLTDDSRDTVLLLQVSKLAEADRDLPAAIRFQELLVKAAPAPETELRLAQLYSAAGETREASAIFVRLAQREEDPERLLRIVDGLFATERNEEALAVIEPKLKADPKNWELLYREGVALFANRKEEAKARFRAILALSNSDSEVGAYEKARQVRAGRPGGSPPAPALSLAQQIRLDPIYRMMYIYDIRRGIGLEADPSQTRTMWSPSAYFQARAAAVGWLSRLCANTEEQTKLEAEFRDRSEKPTATATEQWDWLYYTTVVLQTGDQDRAATLRLAKQGDLAGRFAYLRDIQGRPENRNLYSSGRQQPVNAKVEPLPPDQLDEAVASIKILVEQADDPSSYLSSSLPGFARLVGIELKRAKRDEEAAALMKQITSLEKTPQQIVTSLSLLANDDNYAEAIAAFDRFAAQDLKVNDNKTATLQSARLTASSGLSQLMGASGAPIERTKEVLDRYLAYYIPRNELRRNDRAAAKSSLAASRSYYTTYVKGQQRNVQLPFPQAGQYWDQGALNVLRNAYEVYAAADLATDFSADIEKKRAGAQGASQIYYELARAYVEFWSGEKEAAATYFSRAANLAPHDAQLQFELASLHWQSQNLEAALAVLEKIQPTDQRLVIQKERAVLQFAQSLGDLDRAVVAAKRLFGMRLDAASQIQLAESMRQLGMNEEAESVLKRAERMTATRSQAMAALMTQYLVEGKSDLAAEAAYKILRFTKATGANSRSGQTQDDLNRQSALRCLQQTGKLKDQIALLEAQIERSPQSEPLYTALGEYYTAAGDKKKSEELQTKLLSLRPDDAELRFRIAMSTAQLGKSKEACDLLVEAIRKKPGIMANQYDEVMSVFRSARRLPDLAKLFAEIDLRQLGRYYVIQNLTYYLARDPSTAELVPALVKRAVEAYPEYGVSSFLPGYDAAIVRNPEIAGMIRKTLVPSLAQVKRSPWSQNSNVSHSSDGTISSLEGNLLEVTGPTELADLRKEVEQRLGEAPGWGDGQVLLAMLLARGGDIPAAKKQFETLKSFDYTIDYYAMHAIMKAAQEYRRVPELRNEAIELYTIADDAWSKSNRSSNRSYGPHVALVSLKMEAGDTQGARAMILDALKDPPEPSPGNPGYMEYQHCSSLYQSAQQLEQIGFPTDALKVWRELVVYGRQHDAEITAWNGDNSYLASGETALRNLVTKLSSDSDRSWVKELFSAENKQVKRPDDQTAAPNDASPKDASPIDLLIVASSGAPTQQQVYDSELGGYRMQATSTKPRVSSLLAQVISEKSDDAALNDVLRGSIAGLVASHPSDLQVAVAESLFALAKEPADKQKAALDRLEKLIDAAPLEEIPPGKQPNARQRAAAAPQMGVWFVAKECLTREEFKTLANKLTDRALSAAQRQTDGDMMQALTLELAAAASQRGDKSAAEQALRRLIESCVTPKMVSSSFPPGAASPAAPSGNATPRNAASGNANPGGASARAPRKAPVTQKQFQLAASIAETAASLGLHEVSLLAIREALSGGLPVANSNSQTDPFSGVTSSAAMRLATRGGSGPGNPGMVVAPLQNVIAAWSRAKVPPAEVSKILEELLMPQTRAKEILILENFNPNRSSEPEAELGLIGLLAEWAVRGNRVEEVKKQIEQRKGTLDSAIAGETLLLCMALERNQGSDELSEISALLKTLGGRAKNASTAPSQRLLSSLFVRVFAEPELRDLAAEPLQTLVKATLTNPTNSITFGPSRNIANLVRHFVSKGRKEEAKSLIDEFLKSRVVVYTRFGSSDSAMEYQRGDYAWAAGELARLGELPLTLEAMARLADTPLSTNYYRQQYDDAGMTGLFKQLSQLSPAERYSTLKEWTMPTESRRSIRSLSGMEAMQPIPSELAKAFGLEYYFPAQRRAQSTLSLLVDSAKAASKLDELTALAAPLVAEKLPHASTLELLIAQARSDIAATREALEKIENRWKEEGEKFKSLPEYDPYSGRRQRSRTDLAEFDAIRAAGEVAELRDAALRSMIRLSSATEAPQESVLVSEQLSLLAHPEWKSTETRAFAAPKHWLYQSVYPQYSFWGGFPRLAAIDDGITIDGMANGMPVSIFLKYPLAGDFEFSFEATSAVFGYGGTSATYYDQNYGIATAPGQSIRYMLFASNEKAPPSFKVAESLDGASRYKLVSREGKVRYFVNDQLIHEDAFSTLAYPWIHISGRRGGAAIRKLTLIGEPKILPSVDLFAGDRVDGWSSGQYSQRRLPVRAVRAAKNDTAQREETSSSTTDAWSVENGVLTGPMRSGASKTLVVDLQYTRSLAAGERVEYEFFYEPGKSIAHPALGELGLVIKPEGVHLRWKPSAYRQQSSAISAAELASQEVLAEGAKPISLKEKDWNRAEIKYGDGEFELSINGELALKRKLEPSIIPQFSFFHFPRESELQVRNVRLSGDWPAKMTQSEWAEGVAVIGESESPASFRRLSENFAYLRPQAAQDLLDQVASMSADKRYETLHDWVMPAPGRPVIRYSFGYGKPGSDAPIVSTSLALAAAAKEAGKAASLKAELLALAKEDPYYETQANSLLVCLASATGDDSLAIEKLQSLAKAIEALPGLRFGEDKRPQWLAAYAARVSPTTRPASAALVKALRDDVAKPDRTKDESWNNDLAALSAFLKAAESPAVPASQLASQAPDWIATDRFTAKDLAQGAVGSLWTASSDQIELLTASATPEFFYRAPLAGDFALDCQIRRREEGLLVPAYAGLAIYPAAEGKQFVRWSRDGSTKEFVPIEAAALEGEWLDYRLEVKSKMLTIYYGGKKIVQESLASQEDPWLTLHATRPLGGGAIRSLKITVASPPPAEVALSKGAKPLGWRTDFYGEPDYAAFLASVANARRNYGTTSAASAGGWKVEKGEIAAVGVSTDKENRLESLLRYDRPLQTGDEIRLEFFWETGKTELSPAIGRTALLLGADGAKTHQLTTLPFSRISENLENEKPLEPAVKPALKEKDWNELTLIAAADSVEVKLNGQTIAALPRGGAGEDYFGFFRRANHVGAKVKNVTLKGKWAANTP